MPNAFGYDAAIGWVPEVTWGTPLAPTKFQEFISESLKKTIERVESMSTRSLSELRRPDFLKTWSGAIELEGIFQGQETLLKHAIGVPTTTGPTDTTVYTHVYYLDDALPNGLTLTAYRGDSVNEHRYSGATCSSVVWAMNPNEPLKITYNWVGKDETLVAKTTVTFPDLSGALLIKGHNFSCEIDSTPFVIDSAELTLDNGLDTGKRVMGSQFIAQPVRSTRRKVTGTLTADWASTARYQNFLDGDSLQLDFIFQSPAGVLIPGSAATRYLYQITLPDVRYDGETPAVSSPGIVKQVTPFFALASGVDANDTMFVTIKNALTAVP